MRITQTHRKGGNAPEVEFVSPVFVDDRGDWMTPTPDVLVRFKPEHVPDAERMLAVLAPGMPVLSKDYGDMRGTYRIRSTARDGFDVLDAVNRLAEHPAVLWAEPDWQFAGHGALIPNDPLFPELWGMLNTGQFSGNSIDGDDFAFEYSTDGGSIWNPIAMSSLPFADDDLDLVGALPSSLSGSVLFRIIDTDRTGGNTFLDNVSIDELFVRTAQ